MTTTLPNGTKIPDVASTNWAGDLEENWQLLDAAIGAIGSNVKTNRPNTWTAEQTFSEPIIGNLTGTASRAGADEDGTSIKTGYVNVAGNQTVTGDKSWTGSNAFNNILPNATTTYSLGSSSYQWSSVYAQTYYYNGTQWGLDRANVWTGSNTFTSTITTKTNVDRAVAPSSDTTYGTIICRDKNNSAMFRMQGTIKTDLSNVWDMMLVAPNASYITFFRYTIGSSTDKELRFKAASVVPDDNSTADLGTSTNKWKTLNGINPGALSLPSESYTNIDTTGWSTTGSGNTYTPTLDGWVYVRITGGSGNYISVKRGGSSAGYPCDTREGTALAYIALTVPVSSGQSIIININGTIEQCRFIPCLGNV